MSTSSSTPATLSDLLFHLREVAGGRSELLTTYRPQRRESLSTTDFVSQVHALAVALDERGLGMGDRVALVAENRPEWHVVDFACHLLGCPTVPIAPRTPVQQVAFVLRNSGARWVFYAGAQRRDLLRDISHGLSAPPESVSFTGEAQMPGGTTLTRLQGEGAERLGEIPLERFRGRVRPEDLATLLYTSGTTGDPKGVMLSHRNLISNTLACSRVFDVGPSDRALSFLPLSHILQRTVDYLCFFRGASISYVPERETLADALATERPTLMAAAPAVYENAHREMLRQLEAQPTWRRRLFHWASGVGGRYADAGREGFIGPLLAFQNLIGHQLVHRRIQARFGGRLRLAISGGAPLPEEVALFFDGVGMPLYQGYGLTETSPVLTTNTPEVHRLGSVGKPVNDVELRIAEDGEILVRGPGVMQGYWQNDRATAATVSESGWFRTGDLGRMDKSGYVFITDRKNDMLVLSTGENISPRPIEAFLCRDERIEQAVVVGDGRPFPAVLLVPGERLLALGEEERLLAARSLIAEANERLAPPGQLGGFKLLDRPLTVEDGELTPTLKVRRKEVTRRYARDIAELYALSEPS